MAKYICTVVVETDEPKGIKLTTKKALREAIESYVEEVYLPSIGNIRRQTQIKKVRVRAIDFD